MFEPESEWKLPTEFPDLSRAKYIGIDVESKDPNLQKMGPGFLRGDAEVVGISLATESGFKIYLPFGHGYGDQLDKSFVIDYVKAQITRQDQIKVGANLMYEMEALNSLGLEMKGPLADIQIAEPLLDEDKPSGYSLEQLSWDYLGRGKSEQQLQEAADAFGLDKKRQLWMMPAKHTGVYAEDDALNPIQIYLKQVERIKAENLDGILDMEQRLLPILWKMRKRGIAVDLDRAQVLADKIVIEENRLLQEIRQQADYKVDPWSGGSLLELFRLLGLTHYVRYTKPTKNYPNGQPSFTNEFFKEIADIHPVCTLLQDYRNANKMRRDFVEGLVMAKSIDGRLHPQWHQLRADDEDRANGTTTGRIASSKPNLTQIPTRHPVWGKPIRSLFVPDKGGRYAKHDYSQQEPRHTLHFAFLKGYPGAAEARQRYIDDPSTDYHDMTKDLIFEKTGQALPRRQAKDINLGAAYGMGKRKLAGKLGVTEEVATDILRIYHEGVPFVKKLGERCMEIVQGQGFIRTLLGRKRRFQEWEPSEFGVWGQPTRDYEEAVMRWKYVQRAGAHKAMNSMVQGSAADQTKQAILILDDEGLTPQIQVYDELGQTIWSDKDAWRIKEIMEHAVETTVPHLADPDVGPSWGEVEELVRA